jgi:hypothetical protein
VPVSTYVIRHGLDAGARVVSHAAGPVEDAIRRELRPDEDELVEWGSPEDVYGPGFDPDDVVARFVAIAEAEPRTVYVIGAAARPFQTLVSTEAYADYERKATEATTAAGMVVLCMLDRTLHAPEHLLACLHTHPLAADGRDVKRNERFVYA